jgi:structural maintenance of chromosome 1
MAMDLDEDEDATQRPREVQSYGIEVNFEDLADEDRQVCPTTP